MNCQGIAVGLGCFLIIGVFHSIVIKGEYYFGVRLWWIFLICGILSLAGALWTGSFLLSGLLGVLGFTFFWSIPELFQQRERVKKGWFPAGPSHRKRPQDASRMKP